MDQHERPSTQFGAKEAAAFLPLAYVLAAGGFLAGYARGFDHKIIAFMTFADLFAASLRAVDEVLLPTLAAVLVAGTVHHLRHRRRRSTGVAAIAILLALTVIAVALIAISLGSASGLGNASQALVISLVIIVLLPFVLAGLLVWEDWHTALGIEPAAGRLLLVAAVMFALSLTVGFNKALKDRERHYRDLDRYFACAGRTIRVLRPVGDHYLALDRGDAWLLVTGECEPRFVLRPVKQEMNGT